MTRDYRLVGLSLLFWGLGDGLFLFFQPLYLAQLGAEPVQIGAVLGLAAAALAASHIPAGYLTDRFGPRGLLVAGWLGGAAAATLMFAATDLLWFSAGLVAYSLTGFVLAPLNRYLTESRGAQTVERALTGISAIYSTGAVLSPLLGGLLAGRLGLRAIYAAAAAIFWISTALILLISPQPVHPAGSGGRRYADLLRNRRFLGFTGLVLFVMFSMYVGLPLTPNFLQNVRGVSLRQIGLLGSFGFVGAVIGSWLLGKRPPRRGFIVAQALVGLHMLLVWRGSGMLWYSLAFLARSGFGLAHSLGIAQIGRVVGKAELGMAYGLTETAFALGQLAAPVLAGMLFEREPALPFQVSLGLIALALLLTWRFAPRRDLHTAPEGQPGRLEIPHTSGD